MLEKSRSHLKQHFEKRFAEEGKDESDYFVHLDLSVKQYDIGGERRHLQEYSMAIMYHGVSYYNDVAPDKGVTYDIVAEAFQGDLRQELITALLESRIPFLSRLQYMVVTLNDRVVSNDDLSHRASSNHEDTSTGTSWYLVLAVAGAAVGLLIVIGILIYILLLSRSKNFLELPEKCTSRDDFQNELDLELKSTQSPSPEKSIISQESSKFTYNPRSISKSSTLPSQFSGLEVDSSQQINVEAWQKNAIVSPITPVPFGADISAIEDEGHKDLSMVEECASSQERSSFAESSNASAFKNLSKNSLMSLANLERKAEPPKRVSPPNMYSMSTDDSHVLSEISLNDDGSDLISDLKNLSVQFQQHRAPYREV